ncbi:MAG TPA: metallophosphoesterase family protein [Aggregatilineales bacterium]|nr:metallophosphoesterase family protein [Aggregatilineales bacterium]
MRLAILSDIHGNLVALEAALADIASVGQVDLTWCLGDLAAFGSRPAECVQRIRALADADEGKRFKVIGGNTDRYLVTGERMPVKPYPESLEALQKTAAMLRLLNNGLLWGMDQLTFEDYEFLRKRLGHELSKSVESYGTVIGYHAVPGNDETMLLPDTSDEVARDLLLDAEGCLGVGGHIHRQYDRDLGNWRIVNVGSVGMSFDAPGYAQWGLFTFEGDRVQVDLRQVPYDVDAFVRDLYQVGHPAPEWAEARFRQK